MPSQNRFDGQCCWRSGCCVWRGVRPNPCYIIAGSFQPLIQAWLSCARRVAVAAGNFKPLKAWLSQKIHSKGSLYPSGDALLVQLTGSPLKVRACVHASGGGGALTLRVPLAWVPASVQPAAAAWRLWQWVPAAWWGCSQHACWRLCRRSAAN